MELEVEFDLIKDATSYEWIYEKYSFRDCVLKKNEKGSGPESLTFAAYVWGPAEIFSEIKDGRSLLS